VAALPDGDRNCQRSTRHQSFSILGDINMYIATTKHHSISRARSIECSSMQQE
jgi:hypothetical protein